MSKMASVVFFGVVGVACWTLLACRKPVPKVVETHVFFRDVRVNGHCDIVGVTPVPAESAAFGKCYRLSYFGWRLTRVEHLDDGKPSDGSRFGDSVAIVDVDDGNHFAGWEYLGTDLSPVSSDRGVGSIDLGYSDDGRRLSVCNYRDGRVVEDSNGVAVYLWRLDSSGNRMSCMFVDDAGWRIADADSVWALKHQYDTAGKLREERCLGRDGALCARNRSGVSILAYEHDGAGRGIEQRCYDVEGHLTPDKRSGVAVTRYLYDDRGLMVGWRYYDAGLKPVRNLASGVAAVERTYDTRCRPIQTVLLDADGTLCEDTSGVAIWRNVFSLSGDLLERSFYDQDGSPAEAGESRVATIKYRYDSRGNVIEERYFGRDGMPKPRAEDGAASVQWDYDANGEELETRFCDAQGRLSDDNDLGVSRIRWWVPVKGGSETRYYGGDGRLKEVKGLGAAIVRLVRDSIAGNTYLERSYYDADSTLVETDDVGVATVRLYLDKQGNADQVRFLDRRGNILW